MYPIMYLGLVYLVGFFLLLLDSLTWKGNSAMGPFFRASRARFTISGLNPSSLMNLAKSIPPIDVDPVHELKSSQLNN